ncbi:hypothetical protein ACWGS9_33925 [Bradyrhizobium sp. Arg314]
MKIQPIVESDMGLADGETGADHHSHSLPNALNLRMKQVEQFVEDGAIAVLGIEHPNSHDRV